MFLGTPRDQCACIALETLIRSIVFGRAGCLVAASFAGLPRTFSFRRNPTPKENKPPSLAKQDCQQTVEMSVATGAACGPDPEGKPALFAV